MKKTLTTLLALAATIAMGTAASAADKLTLQLKWVTQAQFAGYFVAADQGFYAEENLDVTIIIHVFIKLSPELIFKFANSLAWYNTSWKV